MPEPPEDSRSFRIAVLVALMAAGGAALRAGVGGPLLTLVVFVGYPVAFLVAYLTRSHRPALLRLIVTGSGALVIVTFATSLTAEPLAGVAALQVPLAEVFLWLLMVHSVDSPGRRSLLITLLSSTVLVAVAGVLSVSMDVAPNLVVWGVAALTALVLAQRSNLARLPDLADVARPVGSERRSLTARTRPALHNAVVIGVALTMLVVLAAGVFMLAPVAGTDRALTFPASLPRTDSVPVLGGISNPSLGSSDPSAPSRPGTRTARASFGYFGFSNQLDTGIRGRPDNTLVMRVRASAPDFWRAQTFDTWDGRVWRASRTQPTVVRGNQPIGIPRAPDDGPELGTVPTDDLVQTYYLERPGPNAIFAAATPTKLFFSDRTVFQLRDGSLRSGVQLDQGSVYTVVSQRRLATADALRASSPGQVPESIDAQYAGAPTTTARVRELAAAVTANAPTTYDKVRALEAWMGEHTEYTLAIPTLPRGEDAVDRFLFVDRRGFCEQIGTSLVVMLRSLGIPARLAVGYATGERNPFTGLYEVRAKDAHAWAEVYFPGVGWQGFDPTAAVPLAGDSAVAAAGTGSLSYLTGRISIPAWVPVTVGLLVLAFALAAMGRFVLRRRRRRAARPAPSWAAERLVALERIGARRGRARAPGETTPEYARALGEIDPLTRSTLVAVARIIDSAMFSGDPIDAVDRTTVDDALADLDQRWRDGPRSERVLVGS